MEIAVKDVSSIFSAHAFSSIKSGIFLRKVNNKLSHWAAATFEDNDILISIGAISPDVNKFAFHVLNETSDGKVKPQFPPKIAPPIFIAISESLKLYNYSSKLHEIIEDFDCRFKQFTTEDWFSLALKATPYAPAQTIILPAYFYLNNKNILLSEYLFGAAKLNLSGSVRAYLDKIGKMNSEA